MEIIKDTPGFWRGIAGVVLGIWLVVSAVNLLDMDPGKVPQREQDIMTISRFFIASGCTVVGLVVLLIVPRQFYIYTGIFCFWGLVTLAEGGSVTALMMYLLGLCFAYKQGFFKTLRRVKILISILLVIGAVSLQYRYGASTIINTILTWVALCMIGGLAYMLFLPELQKLRGKEVPEPVPGTEDFTANAAASFPPPLSDEDRAILDLIRKGEKYEAIAIELRMSVPTVKRRVKRLFRSLRVSDRTEFLIRYGDGLPTLL